MKKPKWNDEIIVMQLTSIIKNINHFPSQKELKLMGRYDLLNAIFKHGGFTKFRQLLNHELPQKPSGYWTDETIISELNPIFLELGHFPSQKELEIIDKKHLLRVIQRHGGLCKFGKMFGYDYLNEYHGKWKDETIIDNLYSVIKINNLNHFPNALELTSFGRSDLLNAIYRCGGLNKFRELLGYDILKKPNGYWTDETIIKELDLVIIKDIGHFPSRDDLVAVNRQDLCSAITQHGGYPKFRKLLGYPISIQEKYKSDLSLYSNNRGRNTEKIVKKILQDYCTIHNIKQPSYNVKLSKGNIIEFVCNTGKQIGIDVTNTERKSVIYNKWTKKSYHNYLDELWIVVVSDSFTQYDYTKWNYASPNNVKVMSIHQFLEELDYSLDELMKNKIDKYCACTFHTKDEFIKSKSSFTDKNTYTILPNTKYNLYII